MLSIIEQLKSKRLAQGMKQSELGGKLGLPQSHISKIEQEATDPRLSTVTDMARILGHELVIVPRLLVPKLNALLHGEEEDERRWQPDDESTS